jgi:hypothetical protein
MQRNTKFPLQFQNCPVCNVILKGETKDKEKKKQKLDYGFLMRAVLIPSLISIVFFIVWARIHNAPARLPSL